MVGAASSVKQKTQMRFVIPDIFLVYVLAISIFFPYGVTVAAVLFVAALIVFTKERRNRLFFEAGSRKLISLLFIPFYTAAFHENLRGMMYAVLIIVVAVCGCFLKNVMTRSLFNSVMDLFCICSIGCAVIAVAQKIAVWNSAPYLRSASVFMNENYYGTITELMVLVCIYRCLSSRSNKGLYLFTIFCNLVGLYLSESMSSLAAMFCAVFVMLILANKKKLVWFFLICIGLCGIVYLLFPEIYPRLDEADIAFGYRLSIWKASVKGFLEYPLFGRGASAYAMICNEFGSFPSYHCHNILLDILLNFGLVGFIGVSIFAGALVRQLYMRYKRNVCRNMNILTGSVLVAILAHGMTDVTIFWIQTGMFFVMIFSSMGIGTVDMLKRPLRSMGDLLLPSVSQKRRLKTEYFEQANR